MFSKVLVANRGEIAIRVMRALKELGIDSVAVYSEADRQALHVREADESFLIGPGPAHESYLVIDRILDVAKRSGAEAIHPGYGFLAENAAFATACAEAGVVFIGPPPSAIEAMGSKTRSRELMKKAGVPIVPGTTDPVTSVEEARKIGTEMGFPIALKAAGGGGGKGFRVAMTEADVEKAFEGASREGEKFFSDPTVYVEKYLENPRHVEIQILADSHGHVVHLGERDCSIQRRHQKVIEETPAPFVGEELRREMGDIAVQAARAVDYRSAGTIEGLFSGGQYHFLEMNTRVQVEHTVTEMVTGIDIVREQIKIAAGEPISFSQKDVSFRGHSIECRINAEAAHKNFAPAPGRIHSYAEPAGPGIRIDSGVLTGSEITPLYDPMVAKLVVWDSDRPSATRRMLRALDEYRIEGITTLIPFHKAVLASRQWADGETCRDLLEDKKWLKSLAPEPSTKPSTTDGDSQELVKRSYQVEVDGKSFNVAVFGRADESRGGAPAARTLKARPRRSNAKTSGAGGASGDTLTSPMQGTVLKTSVKQGDTVEEGALVCVIEAMKMENEITAHRGGTVEALNVSEGSSIAVGDTIAVIK